MAEVMDMPTEAPDRTRERQTDRKEKASEVAFLGRVSTGALDDIRRATDMAYKAVAKYGLNQTIGPVSLEALSGGGLDDAGGASPWAREQGHLVDRPKGGESTPAVCIGCCTFCCACQSYCGRGSWGPT